MVAVAGVLAVMVACERSVRFEPVREPVFVPSLELVPEAKDLAKPPPRCSRSPSSAASRSNLPWQMRVTSIPRRWISCGLARASEGYLIEMVQEGFTGKFARKCKRKRILVEGPKDGIVENVFDRATKHLQPTGILFPGLRVC